MIEYAYFKVTGGKALEAINEWKTVRASQIEARNKLRDDFSADGILANSSRVEGLIFIIKKKVPTGWVPVVGFANTYRPAGSSKKAKEVRARFRSLPAQDFGPLTTALVGPKKGGSMAFMEGLSIHYMRLESIGKITKQTTILVVPVIKNQPPWQAPDEHCKPLKVSQYWALKEKHSA